MLIFSHSTCLGHAPASDHPESPERLRVVTESLHKHFPDLEWREAPRASLPDLQRVHHPSLIDTILSTDFEGQHWLDPDTLMCTDSPEAALRAAGAGIAAVDAVMDGENPIAFCAVRPPGHHATPDAAMGFCLFNNVAIAAAYACTRYGLERVTIVDFDVHHGNGTQDIFQEDGRVKYFSTHQAGLYPETGTLYERGVGNIFNALLPPGSDGFRFRNVWEDALLPEINQFKPQLLMISAGFDAHMHDPMADLMLEADDFAWLTRELRKIADRHSGGRIVSTLEGGYDLEALAECTTAHVGALRE
ncbi:MAG: histone deacetylase family protein [Xanthomonadaceae bacterium]|jgi:acetoin utilization deacetylase AcuC-like enzyme|nr:histone deacetylase family protein [Xanthomonadaceae bacterium]